MSILFIITLSLHSWEACLAYNRCLGNICWNIWWKKEFSQEGLKENGPPATKISEDMYWVRDVLFCPSSINNSLQIVNFFLSETVTQQQSKKKKKKKKATFHFRVHLVPKICKVLNQEVVLSQLHTEPFIPILGENNHKAISQPTQLIRHRAEGHVCLQPCPAPLFQALNPLPGAPQSDRWTLGFPDTPGSSSFRPVTHTAFTSQETLDF